MTEKERHIDVWDNCLRIIGDIIDPRQFATWFTQIRPVSIEGSKLTVEVPSDFVREYIEETYLDVLRKTLRRVIGADARLVYYVKPVSKAPGMSFPASAGTVQVNRAVSIPSYQPSGNPGPFVFPGVNRVQIDPRLKAEYRFETLVEGECNKMGIVAGGSIAAAPGKTSFNALFLFAGPGLGKTHLAQAIGNAVKERFPELIVLYVSGNEFKTQYMDAVKRNMLTSFMAYYMKIDVLIVDDIHELKGQGSQNTFFNVFNHIHQSGGQLIFTSDRAPSDLQDFEERLLSRFKWGLNVELRKPDFKTRLGMLRARSFREGMSIPDDVLVHLATRIKTNFRELEGALISLMAHATIAGREITVALAEQVISDIVGEQQTDISLDGIVKTVCEYFNITRDTLLSKTRKRQIVQARQIAMYECRNLLPGCSLATIGSTLGGKDHATVLHACNTVAALMSTDKEIRRYVADLEEMLLVTVER